MQSVLSVSNFNVSLADNTDNADRSTMIFSSQKISMQSVLSVSNFNISLADNTDNADRSTMIFSSQKNIRAICGICEQL
jgi:hypothetical protein